MKELFVDTSAWYALADRDHRDHDLLAGTLRERLRQGARIVTTNVSYVAETHALLLRRAGQPGRPRFPEGGYGRPRTRSKPSRRNLRDGRNQVAGSNVCPISPFLSPTSGSFVVMSELRIREALTLDHHFTVAGFVALPAYG